MNEQKLTMLRASIKNAADVASTLTAKQLARELARLACMADQEAAVIEIQRRETSDFCTISGDK